MNILKKFIEFTLDEKWGEMGKPSHRTKYPHEHNIFEFFLFEVIPTVFGIKK